MDTYGGYTLHLCQGQADILVLSGYSFERTGLKLYEFMLPVTSYFRGLSIILNDVMQKPLGVPVGL